MSRLSREKGKRGEREVARIISDLLGVEAKRRVRQHDGDSDILGVFGWSIESKNCKRLELATWWRQACGQTGPDELPALFYKVPHKGWRVRWPLSVLLTEQSAGQWLDPDWTADTTPEAWAAVVRELRA